MNYIQNKGMLCLKWITAALLLLLTSAPIIYLSIGAVANSFGGASSIDNAFAFELFIKSIALTLASTLLTIILGLLSAVCIWVFLEKYAVKIAVLILLLILIPPFIHLQSWIFFVDKMNLLIGQIFGAAPNFTGGFAVVLTTAFAFLPVTAGLCLVALLSVPSELADLCALDGKGRGFVKLYLPFLYPSILIGGLFVFLLNINDYGIPSLFGVNVYALELFARFSAGGSVYSVFYSSLPLLLLCVAILILFGWYISKNDFSLNGLSGKNPFKKEKFIIIPAVLGLIVLAFFALVPVCNLLYEAIRAKGIIDILAGSLNEFSYSFVTSLLAAVISLFPAFAFAYLFSRSKARIWMISIAALPFIIPSSILGLSLIKMWNSGFLSIVYQSPIMPSVAMLSRYIFIETIILSVAILRIDKGLIENMRLYYPGIAGFFKCIFPMIWKECLASVLIVFALSMGEFGVTLLVTPPGYQTLTIKIYNYLHYGASETVAVLCLFMLIVVLLVAFSLYFLLTGEKNEK